MVDAFGLLVFIGIVVAVVIWKWSWVTGKVTDIKDDMKDK